MKLKHKPPHDVVIVRSIHSGEAGMDAASVESLLKVVIILLIVVPLAAFFMDASTWQFVAKDAHYRMLIPLFLSGLFFMTVGYLLNIKKVEKDSELKIVECTFNGIRMGTGKFDLEKSFFISWNRVNNVEALQDEMSKNHYLVLCTIDKKMYEIKWDNAFAWVDEESFFSTVKSNASHAKFNWEIEEMKGKDKLDTRYTNLWLHYFSAPSNRLRKGRLEKGVKLQDGEYEIVEQLGGGGQGMAYLARCANEISGGSNLVVLKEYILPVYRGNNLENQKYDRLSSEARILSTVDHPQIVKLFDCFIEDHRGYMVMEYIEGESLNQIVKDRGPFKQEEAARIGLSVLAILKYLHGQETPIIHRDLTPDNLIATPDGTVKLLDFTVAQQDSEKQRTATVVGKQAYIPPEQFRGHPTPQSDIYSLGCTIYFLLTGCDPKPMDVESLSAMVPDIDPELDSIVLKACAFHLKDRYSGSDEMEMELRYWLASLQQEQAKI